MTGNLIAKPENISGDAWGGLAAMLVALPSAIAFGVTIFAPMSGSYAAQGAIAGILGASALGLVAPIFGGTNRLITAPCAPAAAVLAALTIELAAKGTAPESILLALILVGLLCGVFQILFASLRFGRLIKYMPYPVVSGYLSGVGLIIIVSQVPKFLGTPKGITFWQALVMTDQWRWQGIAVGLVTAMVMVGAPWVTKRVPPAILALASGIAAYFAVASWDRQLMTLAGNPFVVGQLSVSQIGFVDAIGSRVRSLGALDISNILLLGMPALTLAVLLSIDTLKTCVILDTLTRSRHDSNRELFGQGLANIAASAVGGIPGAGTMGATLVNLNSGAQSRWSGVFAGLFAIIAFLALGSVIAWVPIAALAAILIVIGFRMIDRDSLHYLRSRATVLDFMVIVVVVVVAQAVGLIAASGVGLALATMLFIREQIGGSVVRRKLYGNEMFSKQVRLPEEIAVLEQRGDRTVIFELQGSLFFGTADQLYTALEPELKTRTYIILDMRHVQSVDVTAAHMLEQIGRIIQERGGFLIFSHLPKHVPSRQDLQQYFDLVGLLQPAHKVMTFGHRDEALEFVEDQILGEEILEKVDRKPLDLHEFDLFKGRKPDTLEALAACLEERTYTKGQPIFTLGSAGDEIFLIRKGTVRVMLPLHGRTPYHLATFRRGSFFGEMAFLDGKPRSADAVALTDVYLYVLSRAGFEQLTADHKRLVQQLLERLATALAERLRHANREIAALQDL